MKGFGLPPLEVLACGALVVGFRAGGGAEYAAPENGFWVADEDGVALADKLMEVLRAYRDQSAVALWDSMRRAGHAAAARYSRAAERERLLEFWRLKLP